MGRSHQVSFATPHTSHHAPIKPVPSIDCLLCYHPKNLHIPPRAPRAPPSARMERGSVPTSSTSTAARQDGADRVREASTAFGGASAPRPDAYWEVRISSTLTVGRVCVAQDGVFSLRRSDADPRSAATRPTPPVTPSPSIAGVARGGAQGPPRVPRRQDPPRRVPRKGASSGRIVPLPALHSTSQFPFPHPPPILLSFFPPHPPHTVPPRRATTSCPSTSASSASRRRPDAARRPRPATTSTATAGWAATRSFPPSPVPRSDSNFPRTSSASSMARASRRRVRGSSHPGHGRTSMQSAGASSGAAEAARTRPSRRFTRSLARPSLPPPPCPRRLPRRRRLSSSPRRRAS
jgi:hypothetical protein